MMSRYLWVAVELAVEDDAVDESVADHVLDVLCNTEDYELPGVVSVDGTTWSTRSLEGLNR